MRQGRVRLGIKKIFSKRVIQFWNRLPKVLMESLSLELFKKCIDVELRNVVSGHGGAGLGLGLMVLVVFSLMYVPSPSRTRLQIFTDLFCKAVTRWRRIGPSFIT